MATTAKTTARAKYVDLAKKFFAENGEDIGMIASNKFNFPVVCEDGSEEWIVVTVTVPLGEGRGKEPYDGYGERTTYEIKMKEKAEKEKANAEKKAKRIAADKKKRAQKEAERIAEEEEGE